MSARDAVIVEAVRTPVGKRKGSLAQVHPVELSAHVLRALASRSGLDPAAIDDVIWGCVQQVGAQSFNIGRNAVLTAGWPESVPATTIDRQCGSSQQSVHFAAAGLISGQYDVAVAGGVEATAEYVGVKGYDSYVSAEAAGNSVVGYACSQCGGEVNVNNTQVNNGSVSATANVNIAQPGRAAVVGSNAVGNTATFYISRPGG